jgi:hypothetical protein
MITRFKLTLTLLAVALALPVFALAAEKNSSSVQIPTKVELNGIQLNPGYYKVEWNGSGPNVQLSIVQGHKTIAQVPARIVDKSYEQQAIVTHQNSKGDSVLDQIQLKNKQLDLSAASRGNSGGNPATASATSGS